MDDILYILLPSSYLVTDMSPSAGRLSMRKSLYLSDHRVTDTLPSAGRLSMRKSLYLSDHCVIDTLPSAGRLSMRKSLARRSLPAGTHSCASRTSFHLGIIVGLDGSQPGGGSCRPKLGVEGRSPAHTHTLKDKRRRLLTVRYWGRMHEAPIATLTVQ